MAVLKTCKGLVTFQNELNKAEGALEKADNIVVDADNTIEIRRGFNDFGNSFATGSDVLKQQFVYKSRIIRHYNSTLEYDSTGSGSFATFSGTYDEVESGVRIKSLETNSNLYFTTNEGIKKISASSASNFSSGVNYITNAGGVKAVNLQAELNFTSGGFLPAQSKCAYRLVWGINDTNNNLILGAPSERFVLENTSSDVNVPEVFELEFTSNSTGDYDSSTPNRYVKFSSPNTNYFLWFSTTANNDQPEDGGTIGRTALEVNIEGLTSSAEIAAAAANKLGELSSLFEVTLIGSTITVTSLSAGKDLNNAESSAALTAVTTTVTRDGNVTTGQTANAQITFTVPTEVNSTNYFYQLYRTAPIEATETLTLDDIDPGEEMNLAFESNITAAEISAGEVTFEDITTEAFRAAGAFLYTNPNTGDGILQSNEKPPIAKDIALFRNSTFYANTKTVHRKQFNFLSTIGLTSGVSDIIIGNSTVTREYTFVGATQVQNIDTVADVADSLDGTYFELNSANNERKYYVWFDTGNGSDPALTNRVAIRVEIVTGDSADNVATALQIALDAQTDFNASVVSNTVTVTWAKNGLVDSIVDNGTGFTFNAPSTTGDGEDAASNEVLLSNNASAAQSIEESSLSLIRVINKDVSSPVNAYYLSGADDLPGIILFESRSLEDDAFYVATSDTNITSKFNPELPQTETITAITAGNPSQITSAGHGLITGDTVYIYSTDSTPAILGAYSVTVLDSDNFTVPELTTSSGTTGLWFFTDFASDNLVSPNRVYFSKTSQPEAVPIVNFIDIGAKDQEIKRIIALRDNLFVLKEDGIYIITGSTAPNFASRLIDGSVKVTAPDTAVVLNNKIYCLASEGVVTITEGGVSIISRNIEDQILSITNSRYNFENTSFGVSYDSDRSYLLWLPTLTTDTVATQCYRYNTFTRTWTRWTIGATCGVVNGDNDKLYIGPSDRNFTFEERKNGDRTDFADRNFTLSIPQSSVNSTQVQISSTSNIEEGDILVQEQYVTISQYNRLLLKLDLDLAMDNDYFSTLQAVAGDSLNVKLDNLNTKLVADDTSGTVTSQSFSSDFATMQTQYNTMIGQLNDVLCDTIFKNYKESTGTTPYEAIVVSKVDQTNTVTVANAKPFIEGTLEGYKGINMLVQWAPQHFGADDTLKQVREGTIIFDQNNFYSATVAYSTDRSANFEEIDFFAKGVGYWGGDTWGENTWGGEGNEVPIRTLIPRDKQRCRYIKVQFKHINGREQVRILGISLEPRAISKRAYR